MAKRAGSSIIFLNSHNEILLLLRDNKPTIPYPNMWDLPGGHVEPGETPEECIIREMMEEMELVLNDVEIANIIEFDDRIEHTYWIPMDFDIESINLHEGQCIKWFTFKELDNLEIAYGFKEVIADFRNRILKDVL